MIPAKHTAQFTNGAAFKPQDWEDSGKPIIRIAQLTGKDFDNFFSGNIDERYHIRNGDLLFSWSATLDSFIWDRGDALLNQHIFKVSPNKKVDKKFLFYSLKHYSQLWADIDAHGSTMKHIKKESLNNKIWLPEHSQQKKIATILDNEVNRINQLIEKRNTFINLVHEKKISLLNQALNGSIINSNPNGEIGWFGRLPSNWPTRRAKFLFKEAQSKSITGNEELLTVSHITGVTKRSEKEVNMFMAETMEGYKLVSRGDVVVNTMWAWMGAMGVSPHDGLISPSYGIYTPLERNFEDKYLDLILRSKAFVAEATRRSKGIHSSRLRLYPDAFLDILLPVPSINEQKEIMSKYSSITSKEDQLVQLNLKSIELLEELKSSLIAEAVTGQLNIEEWQQQGMTDRSLDKIEEDMEQSKRVSA